MSGFRELIEKIHWDTHHGIGIDYDGDWYKLYDCDSLTKIELYFLGREFYALGGYYIQIHSEQERDEWLMYLLLLDEVYNDLTWIDKLKIRFNI